MLILVMSDSFDTVSLRKYNMIISISGVSMAVTCIVPQNTVLTALATGMEELGPVQLRLTLDDAGRPKIDWLARRGLLHNTHTCVQCQVPCSLVGQRDAQDSCRWRCRQCNGRTSLRKGSFFSRASMNLCSRGRRVYYHNTWRDIWVSRLGRWSTGPTSPETSAQRTQQAQLGGSHNASRPSDRHRDRRVLLL